RNEIRRNLFARRRLWVYLLAAIPVVILLVQRAFARNTAEPFYIESATRVLARIVHLYYVRLGIFFACMGIFTWLFRGEVVERTLHYQFLVPVRREVLVIGKFLAGTLISIFLFESAVLACFYLTYDRFGAAGWSYIFDGPGLHQLGAYLLVTALTSIGYGSVFLALSLLFKNPIVPGLVLMGWETIAPILPAWAQRLSVTSYMRHLCPVELPVEGPLAIFTVVAEPVTRARHPGFALPLCRCPRSFLLSHRSHRNYLYRGVARVPFPSYSFGGRHHTQQWSKAMRSRRRHVSHSRSSLLCSEAGE